MIFFLGVCTWSGNQPPHPLIFGKDFPKRTIFLGPSLTHLCQTFFLLQLMWNGPTGDLGLPAVRPVAVGDRVGSGHAPVGRVAQELVLKKKYATATLVQVFHILIWIWPKYVCYSWGHLVNLGTLVKLYKNLRKWKIWQISELCRRINMSWRSKWGKMVQLQYMPRLSVITYHTCFVHPIMLTY